MWRMVGAALIVTSAGLWGSLVARWYQDRARQLREVQSALQLLETEIAYAATTLPEALQRVGAAVPGPVGDLFSHAGRALARGEGISARQAWAAGLAEARGLAFWPDDRRILLDFGAGLGLSHRDDQVRQLQFVREQLRNQQGKAEAAQETGSRLWRYLGFCGGTLVALLLY